MEEGGARAHACAHAHRRAGDYPVVLAVLAGQFVDAGELRDTMALCAARLFRRRICRGSGNASWRPRLRTESTPDTGRRAFGGVRPTTTYPSYDLREIHAANHIRITTHALRSSRLLACYPRSASNVASAARSVHGRVTASWCG